jgi:PAS domain S-box-containing protein
VKGKLELLFAAFESTSHPMDVPRSEGAVRSGRYEDFRRILESAPVAMVMAARDGVIRLFNAEAERIFGYRREEVLFQPLGTLLPERFRQAHGNLCSGYFCCPEMRPMGGSRDLFARRKDGSEFPVEIGLSLVELDSEKWALGTIVDISARKRAEHTLQEISSGLGREVEERRRELERFFDVSLELLCLADPNGYFKRVNPAFTTTLGYSEAMLLARPFTELVHPEDVENTLAAMARLKVGGSIVSFENRYRSASGEYLWMEWNAVPDDSGRHIYAAARNVTERKNIELELRCSNEELQRVNRELREATEHLKSVQMQLIQAEKLDSLGRLAAGVAHEVKNPLAVILMGANFFEASAGPLSETSSLVLAEMKGAIARADRIVKGMLDFSRANEFVLATMPINEIVKQAIDLVHHEAVRARVSLLPDFEEPSPQVRADKGKIEQVLINVLMNAIQAMPQGGDINVRTRLASLDFINRDEGRREVDMLRAGDEVALVEVRDHGSGVPPDVLKRIFEPFFTTKPTGVGCGLGLSVAKSIVELHRGRLQVQNVYPPGLRVRIFLKTDRSSPTKAPGTLSDAAEGAVQRAG